MNTIDITKQEYTIDTKSVQDSFEQELKQYGDSSARIFFSGKYGVGKTKFLERFFDARQDEYLRIHLFPVNYQISTNEDIINLLKYDILVALFEEYEDFFKINDIKSIQDNILLFYVWIKHFISPKNSNLILTTPLDILETIPEIGKLGRSLKSLLDINQEFQQFKSIYEKGEKGIAEEYLSRIKEDDLTETDIISQLIKNKIQEIKGEKKSVLIIDDLDRLDPEHIFRILNILSAHFDQGREQEGDNKFGFDYIIIVGDYNNIQSIFHHKYGKKADFYGYMDKFYTIKPFEFDNRKALLANLGTILEKYQREDYIKNPNRKTFGMVDDILRKSIDSDSINLRALFKNQKYKLLSLHQKYESISPGFESNRDKINRAIDILLDVFGSKEKLIDIIQQIRSSQLYTDFILHSDKYYQDIIKDIYDLVDRIIIGQKPADRYTFKSSFSQAEYIVQFPENSYGVPEISISESMGEITYRNLYYDILSEYISQNKHI
jgi:hypothetical protein